MCVKEIRGLSALATMSGSATQLNYGQPTLDPLEPPSTASTPSDGHCDDEPRKPPEQLGGTPRPRTLQTKKNDEHY
jgi:hypothetical protein